MRDLLARVGGSGGGTITRIVRVTGPLWGESTGDRWMSFKKANGAFLWFAWINDWAHNRDAGDLRRLRAHYDVTVIDDSTDGGDESVEGRNESVEAVEKQYACYDYDCFH